MNIEDSITVQHVNCLGTYLSEWTNMIKYVIERRKPMGVECYELRKVPATFVALNDNRYDLCVVLAYLDSRLKTLEVEPISHEDYQPYSETRVFLKSFFVLFRILLDSVSGIVEYLYKKNEPQVAVPKSFSDLLKNAGRGKLHDDSLCKLLECHRSWITEVTEKRDNLVHNYHFIPVYIDIIDGVKTILGHFNVETSASQGAISIRSYLGIILCQYQMLIDGLLDHFDNKFKEWHKIDVGKSMRTRVIMKGRTALPLWWAHKYGGYNHIDLQVS